MRMRRAMVGLALAMGLGLPITACAHAEAPTAEAGRVQLADVAGTYGCGRATIEIEATGADTARVRVTWGSSAWEQAVWEMTGIFDPATLTIAYEDAVHTNVTYSDEGEVAEESVVYTDGTGSLTFEEAGDWWHLTWDDEREHAADEMVFT